MYLPVVIVLIIGIIIYKLTGGFPSRDEVGDDGDLHQIGTGILDLARRSVPNSQVLRERPRDLGSVLLDLLTQLGMGSEQAHSILSDAGFSARGAGTPSGSQAGGLRVQRGNEETRFALERALLVGIQLARADDDYASVGDEFIDLEALEGKAEAIEMRLFSDNDRGQYVLCQKATLVLQDMLQRETDKNRSDIIRSLLQTFDAKIDTYQEHLSRTMSNVPGQDSMLWGDSRDRRTYYFKMGVTNSLRRSGRLDSLGHLYRYKGVNYDVMEAYDLASQECTQLVAADDLGIDRLLQMGPIEVQSLVQLKLREGGK